MARRHFHLILLWLVGATCAWGSPRVVATSPQLTELLFQLGKGGELVLVSGGSEYPPEAKAIPVLGPLFMPSIERTLKARPDWIVLDTANLNTSYERALGTLGVPFLKVTLDGLEAVMAESERLLRTVYHEAGSPTLAKARRCLDTLPRTASPFSFLALVWLSPPVLFGHRTVLSDLLSRMGGKSALPEGWKISYPQVSEEWLYGKSVDRIYFLDDMPDAMNVAKSLAARWWPKKRPKLVPLATGRFARSSLTPLRHLSDLELGLPAPEECR